MTLSYSRYNPRIKLSPEEMFEISQEINREFAPVFSIKKPEPLSQRELSPEKIKLLPEEIKSSPEETKFSTEEINSSPEEIKPSTEEIKSSPKDIEISPEEIKPSPDKIKLSPKEMFDISEEIRVNFAPRASNNIQQLVLLPVDPDHLYAYWNLGDDKINAAPKNDSRDQLTLRIYSEANKNADVTKTKSWIDVAIDSTQAQQRVFLSMRAQETAYRATIGKRSPDNTLAPFAYSNITQVPLRKAMLNQLRESQIVIKPKPQPITSSRVMIIHTNNNASGQGHN